MSTSIATTDKHTQIAGYTVSWEEISEQLARRIPSLVPAEKMLKWAFFLVRANPKLIDCTPDSFMTALVKAHSLGLDPTMPNTCWLIPRKNRNAGTVEVTFQMGYQGLRGLAMRSGSYRNVVAHVVHENDDFDIELVTGVMHHRPCLRGSRGEAICAYSVAITKDGWTDPELMTVEDVNSIRNRSDAWKKGGTNPWKTDWAEMARKTVLKRHCKRLDMTPEAAHALRDEDLQSVEATTSAPAVNLASLPTVQAKPALSAERVDPPAPANDAPPPAVPADPFANVPSFGDTSKERAKAKGLKTEEELWRHYEGGGKIRGASAKVWPYLLAKYGGDIDKGFELGDEPILGQGSPDIESKDEGDINDQVIAELAERIIEGGNQGVEAVDFVVAQLVEGEQVADEDAGYQAFADALKELGYSYSSCTPEQMAEVWLVASAKE